MAQTESRKLAYRVSLDLSVCLPVRIVRARCSLAAGTLAAQDAIDGDDLAQALIGEVTGFEVAAATGPARQRFVRQQGVFRPALSKDAARAYALNGPGGQVPNGDVLPAVLDAMCRHAEAGSLAAVLRMASAYRRAISAPDASLYPDLIALLDAPVLRPRRSA